MHLLASGQILVLNLKNIAELIKESDNISNEKDKTVLGVIDDTDGLKELYETILNNDFQGDNIITELKKRNEIKDKLRSSFDFMLTR